MESKQLSANDIIAQLRLENKKLKLINQSLIERVEAGSSMSAAPYAAFEHSAVLAEQVRDRTEALSITMAELKVSNRALKEANQEAALAHQRLIDAIESISDAFVLFDKDRKVILYNSHFSEYWLDVGVNITKGISIHDIRRLTREKGLVTEVYSEESGTAKILHLNNDRWVQISERKTGDDGLVVLYTDITDLKASEAVQREKALAQKSNLLQSTVDNLSQGVSLVNADGLLEIWNNRFLELTNLDTMQVISSPDFESLMEQSEVVFLTPQHTLDDNASPLLELEQRLHDGRVIEIKSHPMHSGGYVNTYTDITEHYRYAENLRESERWIRLITDHVPALIAYLGADMCYRFTNQVYDDFYGWPRGSLIGENISRAHGETSFFKLLPYVERALRGESVNFEIEEQNASGENRHMLKSYVPNLDIDGKAVGFFVLIRDITERKRTSEALQQAYLNLEQRVRDRTSELTDLNQKLRLEINERKGMESRLIEAKQEAEQANLSKTKFLAAVSHDLLQPLNAARLFTSALLEHKIPEHIFSLIKSISNSLEDVESLLGTLVDISKLDAGVIKADIASFRLRELLDNLAIEYKQIAEAENVGFHYQSSELIVSSDATLLARILRNLLTNAVRYTPTGGKVLLGCRRKENSVIIQVYDTGCGVPEDKLDEIFLEFKRLTPNHNRQDKGLGLGLAIVDKISRILSHPIHVRSQFGKGSVFSVQVPLGELAPLSLLPDDHGQGIDAYLSGAKIWVVDNDPAICKGMRVLLEGWGCSVLTATSLNNLQEQVSIGSSSVDLLIADYHLDDDVIGTEVVEAILARRNTVIPVLMITANYSNELKLKMREVGYSLINKPIKPLKLKTTLSHLLKGRV